VSRHSHHENHRSEIEKFHWKFQAHHPWFGNHRTDPFIRFLTTLTFLSKSVLRSHPLPITERYSRSTNPSHTSPLCALSAVTQWVRSISNRTVPLLSVWLQTWELQPLAMPSLQDLQRSSLKMCKHKTGKQILFLSFKGKGVVRGWGEWCEDGGETAAPTVKPAEDSREETIRAAIFSLLRHADRFYKIGKPGGMIHRYGCRLVVRRSSVWISIGRSAKESVPPGRCPESTVIRYCRFLSINF
jgi:hypothetical protein